MQELKEILSKIEKRSNRSKYPRGVESWLDVDRFTDWLTEKQIIPFLFKESVHHELIRRSGALLRVLAENKKMSEADLVMLWDSSIAGDKHEDVVRATLDVMQELAEDLPLEVLEGLIKRVK